MPDEQKAEKHFLLKEAVCCDLPDTSQKFPKSKRLLTQFDYNRVFKKSRRVRSRHFQLVYQFNNKPPRLGMIVSRKVSKKAVTRNRIKRLIRESFRQNKDLNIGEYVVLVKPGFELNIKEKKNIRKELDDLWRKVSSLSVKAKENE